MPEISTWLDAFHERKGRPLRVLHLGNVANNAYYMARMLNRVGVHADVLAYSNYHMMSCPEWEEAAFEGVPRDHYYPDWWNLDLGAYERPRWFAQGPWELCIRYLSARVDGRDAEAGEEWNTLLLARKAAHSNRRFIAAAQRLARLVPARTFPGVRQLLRPLVERGVSRSSARTGLTGSGSGASDASNGKVAAELIEEFARRFPQRSDRLSDGDLQRYLQRANQLRPLFAKYDIVHAYGADAIYPCLAQTRPYVALEHGTLRDSPEVPWDFKGPFFSNDIGRLTALSYSMADHSFITNADNLASANRLGLENFSPLGHPIDDAVLGEAQTHGAELRAKVGARWIILCPIRHDWVEKRVDIHIRAIPGLRAALGDQFKVLFMPWGKEVARSRQLIHSLGCDDVVEWIGPFGHVWFARWLAAADLILDQMAYPSFSGTTPRALAFGVPVIVRYDPTITTSAFEAHAPVLAARTSEEVTAQALRALDPEFRLDYSGRARQWYATHHSSAVLVEAVLRKYGELLG